MAWNRTLRLPGTMSMHAYPKAGNGRYASALTVRFVLPETMTHQLWAAVLGCRPELERLYRFDDAAPVTGAECFAHLACKQGLEVAAGEA